MDCGLELLNENPILDKKRMYEVEYPNGHNASLAATAIAGTMFAQADDEGNRHVLFEAIVDHRTDGSEVRQQDAFLTARSGTKRRGETSQGCETLVRWKDGSATWITLEGMKDACPLQLAGDAMSQANLFLRGRFHMYCASVTESSEILFPSIGCELASSVSRFRRTLLKPCCPLGRMVARFGGTQSARK
jgi:hypothetical protein